VPHSFKFQQGDMLASPWGARVVVIRRVIDVDTQVPLYFIAGAKSGQGWLQEAGVVENDYARED
jgi:hypothetical protein